MLPQSNTKTRRQRTISPTQLVSNTSIHSYHRLYTAVYLQTYISLSFANYRAMHFSAKRGLACDRMPSVRPTVRLSVRL